MSKYTLLHTEKPFTLSVPEDAWHILSTHSTLNATISRLQHEISHLPPGTWNDQYRILDPDGKQVDWIVYRNFCGKLVVTPLSTQDYLQPLKERSLSW